MLHAVGQTEFDHAVVMVRDRLDALAPHFERQGFHLSDKAVHNLGSCNRLIVLEGTYVELLGWPPGAPPARKEIADSPFGLEALVFRTYDAEATRERLLKALSPEGRERSAAVLCLDLDNFKSVNDTKGHLAGDQLLKQIADTIHEELDRRHLFIRYGGDEFILLGLHYDLDAMVAFCDHLRSILEESLDGVTLSFGVSTWHGKQDRLRGLIDRADRALYLSKQKGRNTVSSENEEGAA